MKNEERWGIVVGARSLGGRRRWTDIQTVLDRRGVSYDSLQSDGEGSVERLTRMLCTQGYRTVVIVGNDTMLGDAINGMMASQPLADDFAFGLIPIDTGNDFASFWDITTDNYEAAIDNIIERRTRLIDVGMCDYANVDGQMYRRYFLNCVNIGLGARLIELMNRWQRLTGSKRLSLVPVFFSNIFRSKSFAITIRTDSETIKSDVISICFGNTTGYGQTPNAVPYNGLLDMSVITAPSIRSLLRGFWLLGKGRFLNYNNVHPSRIRFARVTKPLRAGLSLDGHIVDERSLSPEIEVAVCRDALQFIISKD